jgi:polyhydroxyalkanoate synthesis regulator phasin
MEANMERFVQRQNDERYRRLIESVSKDGSMTEDTKRQTILNLLAEGRQKQKDAGNQI